MTNNWAIVVGINNYQFSKVSPLRFAMQDALAMQKFLIDEAKFATSKVLLCGSRSEEGSEGIENAGYAKLRNYLRSDLERANNADNLWFFFSGHGMTGADKQEYLMAFDSNPDDLENTAISIAFVTNCLRACKAKNTILILDMCRDETGRKNSESLETSLKQLVVNRKGQRGIITLFSCQPDTSSYEIADLEHGAFTYALLKGLRKHSILEDLADYLELQVPELHKEAGNRWTQVPLVIPAPHWKLKELILSHYATAEDVVKLKDLAINAESDRNSNMAIRRWKDVNLLAKKETDRKQAANRISYLERKNSRNLSDFPKYLREKLLKIVRFIIKYQITILWMLLGLALSYILLNKPIDPKGSSPTSQAQDQQKPPNYPPDQPSDVDNFMSFGEKYIYIYGSKPVDNNVRLKAIELFNAYKYKESYLEFNKLRKKDRSNPIWLIYMNNARVRYWHQQKPETIIHTIATAIPTIQDRGQHILHGVAYAQRKAINQNLASDPVKDIDIPPTIYLEVQVANDNNEKGRAVAIAKKLINEKIYDEKNVERSILAVVGDYASEVTCAALPYYSRDKLPVISSTSTLSKLRKNCGDEDQNKVFFRTASSSQFESDRLAQHLHNKNISDLKIIAFYKKENKKKEDPITEFSEDLFDIFRNGQFKEFIKEENIFNLSSDNEVAKGINQLKNKKANVILLFPNGKVTEKSKSIPFDNAIRVLKEAETINKEYPSTIQLVLASNPILTGTNPKEMSKWSNNLIVAVDWYGVKITNAPQELYNCGDNDFVLELSSLWGGDLDRTTAQSYEAVQLLSKIFENGSNTKYQTLENLRIDQNTKSAVFKLSKNISFKDNGDRKEIDKRILVTPVRAPNSTDDNIQINFIPIDENQCQR